MVKQPALNKVKIKDIQVKCGICLKYKTINNMDHMRILGNKP